VTKLKDCKSCLCEDRGDAEPVRRYCRAGHCTLWCCPWCGMIQFEAGLVACPHKKNENGTLRWYKYPDMDAKPPAPVKPRWHPKARHW